MLLLLLIIPPLLLLNYAIASTYSAATDYADATIINGIATANDVAVTAAYDATTNNDATAVGAGGDAAADTADYVAATAPTADYVAATAVIAVYGGKLLLTVAAVNVNDIDDTANDTAADRADNDGVDYDATNADMLLMLLIKTLMVMLKLMTTS